MSGQFLKSIHYRFTDTYQRAAQVWQEEGARIFFQRSARKLLRWVGISNPADSSYKYEIEALLKNPFFDPSKIDLQALLQPDPQVSIVVPVYNGLSFVPACLRSFFTAPVGISFEVIAIDNGSTDGILPILREMTSEFPNLKVIENTTNVGFAQGINQGAALARGEYLAICNSDILVTPAWLDRLVSAFHQDPFLAVASPVTNYVGEGPQLDLAAQSITPETYQAYAQQIAGSAGILPVADRLVFFCVMVRKRVFDQLGGLASAFGLGNYEDDDFCLRARMAGHTLAIVPGCFVFHHGSRTFSEHKIDHTKWMLQNEKIFYDRATRFSIQSPLPNRSKRLRQPPPVVSVIVRTKDRPHLLRQALNSLANQCFQDFEVVLVNDGGQGIDGLLAEFEPFLDIVPLNFTIPVGRAQALNRGLEKVRGQWITYLDDDDILYPLHLERLLVAASHSPETPVAYTDANKSLCWVDSLNSNQDLVVLDRIRFASKAFSLDEMLIDNWIPIMSFMHNTRLIEEAGQFDPELQIFEDWDFLIRLAQRYRFEHVPRPSCEYRFRFGKQFDDSTLQQRENALKYRSLIYEKYSAANISIAKKRNDTIIAVAKQIEDVRRIANLQLNDGQKSLLIAARLGGFPLPEAMRG